jgi:hypothetical protein
VLTKEKAILFFSPLPPFSSIKFINKPKNFYSFLFLFFFISSFFHFTFCFLFLVFNIIILRGGGGLISNINNHFDEKVAIYGIVRLFLLYDDGNAYGMLLR